MSVVEWIFRGCVIAFGCWWMFLAGAKAIAYLRRAGDRYIPGAVAVLIAKGVPGALLVAFGVTFGRTFFYLALGIAIGAGILGAILDRLGSHTRAEDRAAERK